MILILILLLRCIHSQKQLIYSTMKPHCTHSALNMPSHAHCGSFAQDVTGMDVPQGKGFVLFAAASQLPGTIPGIKLNTNTYLLMINCSFPVTCHASVSVYLSRPIQMSLSLEFSMTGIPTLQLPSSISCSPLCFP